MTPWDAFGWAGQALFATRVIHQWYLSERAGRSHVTAAYWWFSILATPLLLVYVLHREDPVFLVGILVNGFLYARNLWLLKRPPEDRRRTSPWVPVLAGLAVFAFVSIAWQGVHGRAPSWPWLVVGFGGQAVWSSRFVVQWYLSEKRGRSVLPPAFFWISIGGALLLLAYAIHQRDAVMIAAFALNSIPYIRNLVLLAREARETREAREAGGST